MLDNLNKGLYNKDKLSQTYQSFQENLILLVLTFHWFVVSLQYKKEMIQQVVFGEKRRVKGV